MKEEVIPKSLQDSIAQNPRNIENLNTSLDAKPDEKAHRRSPVIIKAYESMDNQNNKLKLLADQSSLNIENSQVNSQDMVHILSGNEVLS